MFVVGETKGVWGPAEQVPGLAALNQGGYAEVNSVSCGSAGNCSAGGFYRDSSGQFHAFLVSQTNGTWGTAIQVPGAAGRGAVESVSCASAGRCSAGGGFSDGSGTGQAFVVNEN
jgi:hypothetical protein